MMLSFHHNKQRGLSLIELMIAIVIGLFLTAGLIQLFVNSKQNYRVQENLSRVQENGRFAMNFLAQDIRMADYWGCLPALSTDRSDVINNNLNANATYNNYATALAASNADTHPTNATVDGSDTDTITLRGVANNAIFLSADMATVQDTLTVSSNSLFSEGSIVFMSDCSRGDIFKVSNTPTNGVDLEHKIVGGQTPGNSSINLQQSYKDESAKIHQLNFATYFIQPGNTGEPSLYRTVNGNASEELVEGVEDMQILYGEDTDSDGIPNYYVPSGTAGLNLDDVVSVRVSIAVRSFEDNLTTVPRAYTILGDTVTPTDRRIRRVFTATIAIRNRLP